MDKPTRFLLIDGHAVAYRAFYAIRELSTSEGIPTNALYGFIRMSEQLVRQWKPTHYGVVFDGGLPLERMDLLATYKAQREEMPEPLSVQFPLINEYLSCARVPALRVEQEEADDVMATLAREAETQGAEVLLATHDKDLFQLVSDRVFIVPPTKSDVRMGVEDVVKKTGVSPQRIAAWLALVGDSADNIPGVPGIGPKTAAKLLADVETLDQLYASIEGVKQERLQKALQAHRDAVERNMKMTCLRTDLPLDVDWNTWRVGSPDVHALYDFFKRMEFNTMAKALTSPTLFDV